MHNNKRPVVDAVVRIILIYYVVGVGPKRRGVCVRATATTTGGGTRRETVLFVDRKTSAQPPRTGIGVRR